MVDSIDSSTTLVTDSSSSDSFILAKDLFDLQFPLINLVEIGDKAEIHIALIEQEEYKDIIELESNFGTASSFTTLDTRTG